MKKLPIRFFRVIWSLLDGMWKTAPDISREWNGKRGKGTTPESPYRDACKIMCRNGFLKSKALYPRSKRSSDKLYALNLTKVSEFFAERWEVTPRLSIKLLGSPLFQKYVIAFEKPKTKEGFIYALNKLPVIYFAETNNSDHELWNRFYDEQKRREKATNED